MGGIYRGKFTAGRYERGKILDVACGTGNVTLPLVQKGYDLIGVDLSEEMLTVAQQKLGGEGHFIPLPTRYARA